MPLHAAASATFRQFSILFRLTALALSTCLLSATLHAQTLPTFEQVKAAYISSDAILLDRHGEPLADLRLNPDVRRLAWVELQTLSPAMREALLAAEDKRFFEHAGIDWKAFLGAAWQNIWGRTRRGASTLTMQLAGLLEPRLQLPGRGNSRRNLSQKWDQSFAALELEKRWSKEQILEAYFNLAPFRGDLEGIGAASQILLGVTPQGMSRREAVILAALLRGPNANAAVVARRACILANLLNDKKLCPQISQLVMARLDAPRNVPRFALAPHLARSLLRQRGQQLTTTLDANTQRSILSALSRLVSTRAQNASVIVLDNASGEVLAWAGALQARDPDGLIARQALSQWWQPFAVELGIEQRIHTAVSLLVDAYGVLDAKDARAGHHAGILSLRAALQTHNGGALREQQRELVKEIGSETFNERLRQLGLDPLYNFDGTSDISLSQLAGAWHALTGASYLPVSALPVDPAAMRRVLTPAATFITQDMLADTFAGGWRSSWSMASADGHQQVVVGNTDRFTVLTSITRPERVDRPDEIARAAQQLWKDVVSGVQKDQSRSPSAPDGVTSSIVLFEPPTEAVRREWFLRGTELDRVMAEALPQGGRIKVPRHGQIYTLNNASQVWTFDAAVAKAARWQVDGIVIWQGAQASWTPSLGRHRVVLLGPRDEVLDTAEFQVIP